MSIVAGVDFGTLSVRVSIFDHQQGRLGSATADYPLLRKKDDPDHATQSHRDHMNALVSATRKAIEELEAGKGKRFATVDEMMKSALRRPKRRKA